MRINFARSFEKSDKNFIDLFNKEGMKKLYLFIELY